MLVASDEATFGSVMAKQERIEPSSSGFSQRAFCVVGPVDRQDLHVADIGRVAVEDFGRGQRAAEHLAEMRVFEIGKPLPFRAVIVEQVPQPFGAGFLLEVLDQRARRPLPGLAFGRRQDGAFVRIDMRVHEGCEPRPQRCCLVR